MNNAVRINVAGSRRGNVYNRYNSFGYSKRNTKAKRAPVWLIALCRVIVWLWSERVADVLRPAMAIGAVALLALVAGAMEFGSVPLFEGTVICLCISAMALFATRD